MTHWCDLRCGDVLVRKGGFYFCLIYVLSDARETERWHDEGGTPAVKFYGDGSSDVRPIRSDPREIGASWELFLMPR